MKQTPVMAALALALTGCAHRHMPASAPAPMAGARYVALGSSFAAGSGFGPIKPDSPRRCGRSTENYASLLAARLGMALVDASCGGATTAHILGPWNELPPQIEAVTPDTRLVTVTVGGNDIGYVGYLMGESCKVRGPFRTPLGEMPCFDPKVPSDAAYVALGANLRAIAAQVKARAPSSRLVFVQYVTMVPDRPCNALPLDATAAATARAIGKRLAEVTAKAASDSGATVLAADRLSARHTPCDAQPWSVGYPAGLRPEDGAPWHPNRAGQAALASALEARLRR